LEDDFAIAGKSPKKLKRSRLNWLYVVDGVQIAGTNA